MSLTKKQKIKYFEEKRNSIKKHFGDDKYMRVYLKEMLDLIFEIQLEILK